MDDLLKTQDEQIARLSQTIAEQNRLSKELIRAELQRTAIEEERLEVIVRINTQLDYILHTVQEVYGIVEQTYQLVRQYNGAGVKMDVVISFISVLMSRLRLDSSEAERLNTLLEKAIGGKMQDIDLNVNTGGGQAQVAGNMHGDMHQASQTEVLYAISGMKDKLSEGIEKGDFEEAEEYLNGLPEDTMKVVLTALTQGSLAGLLSGARVMLKLVKGQYKFKKGA